MANKTGATSSLLSRIARPSQENVCWRCRTRSQRRTYAGAATATKPDPSTQQLEFTDATAKTAVNASYQMRAGVVLSRAPQITRDLTPFEKAFYLYQRRLNERLALPFTKYFYFRRDTPAEIEWRRKMKTRQTPARDLGGYQPYTETGWDDELRVGSNQSEPDTQMEALLKDALPPPSNKNKEVLGDADEEAQLGAITRPAPRTTQADEKEDQQSLNRALQRTLYFVCQGSDEAWTFPSAALIGNESLHLAAERVLVQGGGVNMNTWVVGNAPAGHLNHNYGKPQEREAGNSEFGFRTFFMKARIMAGQADLSQSKLGFKNFKWLTKEEVQKLVTTKYWHAVRNMLSER